MGDLVTEAECVCGEFLWPTADILFDDEILRVAAFSPAKGEQTTTQKNPPHGTSARDQ